MPLSFHVGYRGTGFCASCCLTGCSWVLGFRSLQRARSSLFSCEDFAETTIRPTSVPSSYAYNGQYSPAHGNGAGRRCTERYSDGLSDLYPDTYPERYVGRYHDRYTEPYPDRGAGPYAEQYPMPLPERYSKRYAEPYQEQQFQDSYRPYDRPYDRQYDKYPERYGRQYPERPLEYPEPCVERYNAYQSSSLFTDPRNSRPEMPPLPQQMPPPPPSVQTPPPPLPPPPPAPKKSRAREAPVMTLGSMPENLLGSPELPSVGSRDHRLGGCKPCAFLVKGCQNGIMCKFCHLCDAGEKMLGLPYSGGSVRTTSNVWRVPLW
ncbi:hpaIIM [Symbiodinium sp. CCMP2592]|nr:hpaIIM [Symbiodinium sp. CCMP2592]